MALPHGRKIVVDGKTYQWLCKPGGHVGWEENEYGDMECKYGHLLTVVEMVRGAKIHRINVDRTAVNPKFVAEYIRRGFTGAPYDVPVVLQESNLSIIRKIMED